ncbi:hypothetical protein K7I13_11195 [Brucepastera parasyntrophica]|uniref:hypothetical protein n=1 Tax=Brucepastera parasyntrophica TaxID=2880008 RepID=UPI00210C8306|nr:hypothetical protein [Brucepastera parasyntrophica]ULQ59070.1 hypothetical protein K7I13_11195 [Brucepastera parasyntrophica]
MKLKQRGIIILCLLLCCAGLFAQQSPQENSEPMILTVDDAVSLAMENNIQLSSTAIDLRIKKRANDLFWNLFLPSVQVTGTVARTNNMTNPYDAILQVLPGYTPADITEPDHWTVRAGLP